MNLQRSSNVPPILKTPRLPVIAAPLFIISVPDLVIAQCKAGVIGSFPALNAREKEGESIKDLIEFAGGFSSNVTKDARLELSTINNDTKKRDLDFFTSNQPDKLSIKLKDGDSIKVFEHASLEESSIVISGEVQFPGTYTVQKGDRLLDVLERSGGISDQGYTLGSVFTRERIAEVTKWTLENERWITL